jgi:hypothetical protein
MGRGPCTFKKQNVTRFVQAVIAAGLEVQQLEMDREGKIVAITGKSDEVTIAGNEDTEHPNALDDWRQKHARENEPQGHQLGQEDPC